jgi:hypothetical protein
VAGVLGTVLAGCSALSPATIATPYAAADGVDSSLSDVADGSTVKLRNMLIVTGPEGGRGQVIGTLTNTGTGPVQVLMALSAAAQGAAPTPVTVPAGGAVQLGAGDSRVVLDDVPAAGRMAGLTVTTQGGGTADLTVPVMAAEGFYASLTPPPPSPTATPTPPPPAASPSQSTSPATASPSVPSASPSQTVTP